MKIRRRLFAATIATAAIAVAIPTVPAALAAASGTQTQAQAQPEPQAHAAVVRVARYRAPNKKVVHHRFRPWRHPSPSQVREIIRNEARRWHVPAGALAARVWCESRYHWYASNGQYAGVLQFGWNAFARGMSTIRSREVKIVRSTTRRVHDARVTYYADGTKSSRRTTPRRQRLVVVYTGRIPRHPALNDAFAQIRIGAQALRGISAVHSSEWSCGA